MSIPASYIIKTKNPKPGKVWSYNRRLALARQIEREIYPRYLVVRPNPIRSFEEEAKTKLPALFAEIEKHNKKAKKHNELVHKAYLSKRQKLIDDVLFGDDKACQKAADTALAARR